MSRWWPVVGMLVAAVAGAGVGYAGGGIVRDTPPPADAVADARVARVINAAAVADTVDHVCTPTAFPLDNLRVACQRELTLSLPGQPTDAFMCGPTAVFARLCPKLAPAARSALQDAPAIYQGRVHALQRVDALRRATR